MKNLITPEIPFDKVPKSQNIFLAGPIKDTENWQLSLYKKLHKLLPSAQIISPVPLKFSTEWNYNQVQWETEGFYRCKDNGGLVIIWIQNRKNQNSNQTTSQITMLEAGRVAGWLDFNRSVKVIAGIHPDCRGTGIIYLKQLLENYSIPVCDNLDDIAYLAHQRFFLEEIYKNSIKHLHKEIDKLKPAPF